MPRWFDYEQGSDDWLVIRLGKLTASKVSDALAVLKDGSPAKVSKDLMIDLIAEYLSRNPTPLYVNGQMLWGLENEPGARRAYEAATGNMVDLCGFALHDTIDNFGASPDGLVDENGLVEIKCPETSTHVEWMLGGTVPDKHLPQIWAQLSVTGRGWCDFVSYDPRLPSPYNLFIRRVYTDSDAIAAFENRVMRFMTELNRMKTALEECRGIQIS